MHFPNSHVSPNEDLQPRMKLPKDTMVRKLLLSNTAELYWVYGNSGGRNHMPLCLRIQFNGTWISPKPMRPRVAAWPRIRSLQWEIVRGNRLQEPPKHRSSGSQRY